MTDLARSAKPKGLHWERHIHRKYNITMDEYYSLLDRQGHVCAICGSPNLPPKNSTDPDRVKMLTIDHDHSCCDTGRSNRISCGKCVRGLLCNNCNTGLGAFKDSIRLLAAAIVYLEDYGKSYNS